MQGRLQHRQVGRCRRKQTKFKIFYADLDDTAQAIKHAKASEEEEDAIDPPSRITSPGCSAPASPASEDGEEDEEEVRIEGEVVTTAQIKEELAALMPLEVAESDEESDPEKDNVPSLKQLVEQSEWDQLHGMGPAPAYTTPAVASIDRNLEEMVKTPGSWGEDMEADITEQDLVELDPQRYGRVKLQVACMFAAKALHLKKMNLRIAKLLRKNLDSVIDN